MDQDKIGKFIKDVRTKNQLSQEKFGEKYGVTYQAVSKWENGKNLPDISILKEICNDYNKDINELLNNNSFKYKKNKLLLVITIYIIVVIISLSMVLIFKKLNKKDDFEFKIINTTCDNFELYGSIAYGKNKTSIYISNITYCGIENNIKYKKIECTLYELDGDTKTKIESINYSDKKITLEEFLKQVKFNVDHYSDTCKMYKDNGLFLEIKATDEIDQTTIFDIPLEFKENC